MSSWIILNLFQISVFLLQSYGISNRSFIFISALSFHFIEEIKDARAILIITIISKASHTIIVLQGYFLLQQAWLK